MRKIGLFVLCVTLCFVLNSCVYSSANLMRAKGENITVFGAWGYVNCKNSAVTLYRSTDAIAYPKKTETKYPKIPARPTVTEDDQDITIGTVSEKVLVTQAKKVDAKASAAPSVIEQAAAAATGSVPLPK